MSLSKSNRGAHIHSRLGSLRSALLSEIYSFPLARGALTIPALVALSLLQAAPALSNDWLSGSAAPNDWFTGGNWSEGSAPVAGQAVTIDTDTPNTGTTPIITGGDAFAGTLIIGNTNTNYGHRLDFGQGGTLTSGVTTIANGAGVIANSVLSSATQKWTAGNLTVANQGQGGLYVLGGGTLVGTGTLIVGNGSGGDGTLGLSDAGTTATFAGNVTIGNNGQGTLSVESGAILTTSANFRVGNASFGSGIATVNGGKVIAEGTTGVSIGSWGPGTLIVSGGGAVEASQGRIELGGYGSGVSGTLIIGGETSAASAGTLTAAQGLVFNNVGVSGNATGTLILNHTDTGYDLGIDISSNASILDPEASSLIAQKAGTTIYSGDGSAFLGMTSVTGGSLLVTNALAGTLTASGGVLGGTGTLGSADRTVTIANGGTLAPGLADAVGTLNVAGDLVFESGSTYGVHVTNAAADRVNVAGTAAINGGTVSVTSLDAKTSYQSGQTYTILTADSGLSGTFSETLSNSIFLDVTTSYDANNAYLTIALNDSEEPEPVEPEEPAEPEEPGNGGSEPAPGIFAPVAETSNQLAVATALDTLEQSGSALTLYNRLLELTSVQDAHNAFEQLSGVEHASVQTALLNQTGQLRSAIGGRLGAAFGGVETAATPILSYMPVADDAAGPGWTEPDPVVVWAAAYGSRGAIDADTGTLDTDSKGILIGLDDEIGAGVRLGVVVGYGGQSASGPTSAFDTDNYLLGLYGGSSWGALSLRAGLAYGWHETDSTRNVNFGAFSDSLAASYSADSIQGFGELAYTIKTDLVAIEPYAGLAHVRLRTNKFTETGGAAALSVEESLIETTFASLGVRASADLDLGTLPARLSGQIGYQRAFGDNDAAITAALAGSEGFTVTAPLAESAVLVGAGLDFQLGETANLGLSWNGQFAEGSHDNSIMARLGVSF